MRHAHPLTICIICRAALVVQAQKNYAALKTGIRYFVSVNPAYAPEFATLLNEATAFEKEDGEEEAAKVAAREAKKATEAGEVKAE